MKFLTFAALFAAVLAVVGLLLPVPGDFSPLYGGALSGRHPADRCLVLVTRFHGYTNRRAVRLRAEGVESAGRPRYQADFGEWADPMAREGYHEIGNWSPAGPDSMDLSPNATRWTIRLPLSGDTLVGRSGWTYFPNLWTAFTWERPSVRAFRMPCDSLTARAAV